MEQNLSYATARAMLRTIEQYTPADFDTLGITEENFETTASQQPWRREQRTIIIRTLNAILFGSLEIMAIPKLIVPAEFVAAHVATIVAPANRMVACVWLAQERQTGVGALELAARQVTPSQYDPCSADHLFALVCLLSDTEESNFARDRFRTRLGLRINEAARLAP